MMVFQQLRDREIICFLQIVKLARVLAGACYLLTGTHASASNEIVRNNFSISALLDVFAALHIG